MVINEVYYKKHDGQRCAGSAEGRGEGQDAQNHAGHVLTIVFESNEWNVDSLADQLMHAATPWRRGGGSSDAAVPSRSLEYWWRRSGCQGTEGIVEDGYAWNLRWDEANYTGFAVEWARTNYMITTSYYFSMLTYGCVTVHNIKTDETKHVKMGTNLV